MSGEFAVILEDLKQASDTFTREAGAMGPTIAKLKSSPVDTGDGTLNNTLQAVLELLGTYGDTLQKSVQKHGSNLKECHDTYRDVDADVRELFDKILAKASTD
jgi:hypothetical protein